MAESLFRNFYAEPPPAPRKRRLDKAPGAFLTIGELAQQLQLEQHVLRFWEGKFPQIQPLKRGGGRRYYRPEDVALIRRIQTLLYGEGYTIRGVQNLLAAEGDALAPASPRVTEADDVRVPRQYMQKLIETLAQLRNSLR